jgi:hypothetical protein
MGIWFFLSVMVGGSMLLKAYKLKMAAQNDANERRIRSLELELKAMREKIALLDDAVFLGDFELRRQFQKLEQESLSAK